MGNADAARMLAKFQQALRAVPGCRQCRRPQSGPAAVSLKDEGGLTDIGARYEHWHHSPSNAITQVINSYPQAPANMHFSESSAASNKTQSGIAFCSRSAILEPKSLLRRRP